MNVTADPIQIWQDYLISVNTTYELDFTYTFISQELWT